jgi:DNA-binding beta-propeller fold protein YncE
VGFADTRTNKQTHEVLIGGKPISLTMSPDGQFVYAGIQDQDKVIVLSVPQRKIVRVIETPKGAGPDPAIPLP